jgi:hypothetical protein
VTFSSPFQVWHAIGFPIMLLARLFEVDGDPKWQRLAERFVAMFDRCEQAWIDLSVGKAAWGFAVLYRATGDTAYRRRALRATRGIVSWQDADGGWLTCLDGIGGTENAVTSRGYEISTELVTWLAAVGGILAEREGSRRIPPAQTPDRRSIELWAGRAERFMARRRRRASAKWQRMRNRARPTFTRLQRT